MRGRRFILLLGILIASAMPLLAATGVPRSAGTVVASVSAPSSTSVKTSKSVVRPVAIDLSRSVDVIELRSGLSPFHEARVPGRRHLAWYVFHAGNTSKLPVSRILLAGEAHGRNIRWIPYHGRPAIRQVQGASPNLLITRVKAYGAHAWRVRLPPHGQADVAIALDHAAPFPSVMAWREPALAAHSRWMAVYATTVAVLIAAAACIAAGLALLKHQPALRWGAALMFSLLLMQLARSGVFDAMLSTPFGGPFGVESLFTGTSLACAAMLLNHLMPFGDIFLWMRKFGKSLVYSIVVVSLLAYVGVPVTGVSLNICTVIGVLLLTAYVLYGWTLGLSVARGLAPSAVLFSLSGLLSVCTALGVFGRETLTPDMSGAFLAAAVIVAVLSMMTDSQTPEIINPAFSAAREAIGAARQGVFVCDFGQNLVSLSPAAAGLFGWGSSRRKFSYTDWLARLVPEDREKFSEGLEQARQTPGTYFRLEFRGKAYSGEILWFELRALARGIGETAESCIGMLADITLRKTTETQARDLLLRDSLTGAGNRMALLSRLEENRGRIAAGLLLMLDVDGFRGLRARRDDVCCNLLLQKLYERLQTRLPGADIFRVGGDCFAIWLADPPEAPARLAETLLPLNALPYQLEDISELVPFSIGIAEGHGCSDPFQLISHAEYALVQAQKRGMASYIYKAGNVMHPGTSAETSEVQLLHALEAGAIQANYTPVVRLGDKTVAGFTVSLFGKYAGQGFQPCEMAFGAGDMTLIAALQQVLIQQSVMRLTEWQQYFPLTEPLRLIVPVLGAEVEDDVLIRSVRSAAGAEIGFASGSLQLAINHHQLVTPGLEKSLQSLCRVGIGTVLTGYAGRAREDTALLHLRFDAVLTDRGLADHAQLRREGGGGLPDFISRVHARSGSVLVDGIESAEAAAKLMAWGADLGCGTLFSGPLNADHALKYIAGHFRSTDSEIAI